MEITSLVMLMSFLWVSLSLIIMINFEETGLNKEGILTNAKTLVISTAIHILLSMLLFSYYYIHSANQPELG